MIGYAVIQKKSRHAAVAALKIEGYQNLTNERILYFDWDWFCQSHPLATIRRGFSMDSY